MKFFRTDKDILLGNPRSIELIDKSRILFFALTISELKIFLSFFERALNFQKDKNSIQIFIDCKTDLNKIKDYLIDSIKLDYDINGKPLFDIDLINVYWDLLQRRNKEIEKRESIEVLDIWEALVTIIEQNQLIELINSYSNTDFDYDRETYTNSFNILEIIDLKVIEGLNLLNWDEKLTHEQRKFYTNLVQQKNNKQIENTYLSLSIAISNNFGGKINLKEILFPMSKEEEENRLKNLELKALEDRRKNYMKEIYTGIKEIDDKYLIDRIREFPHIQKERFFVKEEIETLF